VTVKRDAVGRTGFVGAEAEVVAGPVIDQGRADAGLGGVDGRRHVGQGVRRPDRDGRRGPVAHLDFQRAGAHQLVFAERPLGGQLVGLGQLQHLELVAARRGPAVGRGAEEIGVPRDGREIGEALGVPQGRGGGFEAAHRPLEVAVGGELDLEVGLLLLEGGDRPALDAGKLAHDAVHVQARHDAAG
jgi:hypothetical protein